MTAKAKAKRSDIRHLAKSIVDGYRRWLEKEKDKTALALSDPFERMKGKKKQMYLFVAAHALECMKPPF